MKRTIGNLVGAVALLALVGVLVFGDAVVGRQVWSQYEASRRFVEAPGQVVESAVETYRGSKGKTRYRARIRYAYEVDGRRYAGSDYDFAVLKPSRQSTATERTRRFPVGSTVPVYHDPDDPARAVLDRDFHGNHLLPLVFLLPINLAVAWVVIKLATRLAGACGSSLERRIVDDGLRARVRPIVVGPLATAVVVMCVACGIGGVVLAIAGKSRTIPATVPVWVLGGAAVLASTAYWGARSARDTGRRDLVVDRDRRTVVVPLGSMRRELVELAWSDIEAIEVVRHERKGPKGQTIVRFAPELVLAASPDDEDSGDGGRIGLDDYAQREAEAERLAAWLREAMG